jgi:hypothetical protein
MSEPAFPFDHDRFRYLLWEEDDPVTGAGYWITPTGLQGASRVEVDEVRQSWEEIQYGAGDLPTDWGRWWDPNLYRVPRDRGSR